MADPEPTETTAPPQDAIKEEAKDTKEEPAEAATVKAEAEPAKEAEAEPAAKPAETNGDAKNSTETKTTEAETATASTEEVAETTKATEADSSGDKADDEKKEEDAKEETSDEKEAKSDEKEADGETKEEAKTEEKTNGDAGADEGKKEDAKEEAKGEEEPKPADDTKEEKTDDSAKEGSEAASTEEKTEEKEKDTNVEMKDESKTEETVVETPKKRGRGRPPKRKTPGSEKTSSSTPSTKPKTPKTPKSAMTTTTPSTLSSKRQRKTATAYTPSNFKEERLAAQTNKECPPGRGVPLSSLSRVKNSISKLKNNNPILTALYRFIFGTMGLTYKGKPAASKIKAALMQFSGFLSAIPDPDAETKMDVDGEEKDAEEPQQTREERDEELMAKFEAKAMDSTAALIKSLLDVLQIDRGTKTAKRDLVKKLLAFLAEPSATLVKDYTMTETVDNAIASSTEVRRKRGRPRKSESQSPVKKKKKSAGKASKKKKKKEEAAESDDYVSEEEDEVVEEVVEEPDDDDEDEVVDGKTIPSAKKLRTWVKAYVTCFDLSKCSAKHALSTASDKFKVDLDIKKDVIMEMLKEAY